MSTDYRIEKKIKVADFLSRLAKARILEVISSHEEVVAKLAKTLFPHDEATARRGRPELDALACDRVRTLTDGNNYLAFHVDDDGTVQYLTRYAWCRGAPVPILNAIAKIFDTKIWSERHMSFIPTHFHRDK